MLTQTGRLIDLAPDGLGFVIPAEQPRKKLAFLVRDNPKAAKMREGQRVRFRLNSRQQIEDISAV